MHYAKTHTRVVRRLLNQGLFASALLAQPFFLAPVAAQVTPIPVDDEVVMLEAFDVVAGFSGSLAQATEMKQREPLVAEFIAAEDIGKLPDISIAESLTRLPGITTQRLNGRAQALVIRGMNGDFGTALLNGREQVSTGAGRAVEFDQYPAELLSNVAVYKTADASFVAQGLSGTVDLRTVRPLESGGRVVAGNFFYEWNDMDSLNAGASNSGTRFTLSYVDQFLDNTLGIAIGISSSNRPGQGEQWNAWGYPQVGAATDPAEPFVLGGAKPFVRTSELERDGVMAVVEYAPNDWFRSTIDIYFSEFFETQILRGIEIPLFWSSAQFQPGFTVEDGLITQGTFANIFAVVRNDIVTRDAEVTAGGWNFEFGDESGWMLNLDLSYSKVERTDVVLETYSGFASNQVGQADTMTYTLGGTGGGRFTSALDYSNANGGMTLTSPQGWASGDVPGGQVGFVKGPFTRDLLTQHKVAVSRPLESLFNRIEFGAAYTRRSKFEFEAGPGGREGFFLALPNGATSAPLPPTVGQTDLSFLGLGTMYSYDPLALYNSGYYDEIPNNNPSYVANNWDVKEQVYLGYAKVDFERPVGNHTLSGNVGAQVILTEQRATGLAANGAIITPVTGTHDYVDFVPSLHLNYAFNERSVLRFSAARQLVRQRMSDLRAGSTFGYNQALATSTDPTNSPWSGGGGNPELEPWRSDSFDLSYEQYFADNMGYWAVAAFYKDLVSYTYNQPAVVSFAGFPTGLPEGSPGSVPAITEGLRFIPQNGDGGYVRGLEFTLSLPGEKLVDALKGWGFIGSVSFFDSSIQPDPGNPATPLPGLSDRVMSGTIYYERGGFEARLSARYRSDFRGDIATFGPRGEVFRNLQSETVLDAQVSYTFRRGMLDGLALIAQAYNLTDEPLFAASGDDVRFVQDYQRYGTSYSVGVSYKF